MDLDQAVLIRRAHDGLGFVVFYAIADVAAWLDPAGEVAAESFRRGLTLYSPDLATPLHPHVLSEDAASLMPRRRRPAVLWTMDLDETGRTRGVAVERVWVTSVARLDYPAVTADIAAGTVHPSIELLPDVGKLRQALARERHAITLDLPDVEVSPTSDAPTGTAGGVRWRLTLRAQTDIEQYNAEISLLTGMCAASIMLDAGVGILRTLPAPDLSQIAELRSATAALGIPWPAGTHPADVMADLDAADPRQNAFLEQAAKLLRGAGYRPFGPRVDGYPTPAQTEHAGIGAPYAHVTAPLRRLVDRFGTEICLAAHSGDPIPEWVVDRLGELPAVMAAAGSRANALERACIGAVAALLLMGREGEVFSGTVLRVDQERDQAVVVLTDPPVRAKCAADGLQEGASVEVVLVAADPAAHSYTVRLAADRRAATG